MLASNPRFFVLSEPQILSSILDPGIRFVPAQLRWKLLSAAVNALADCAPREAELALIKWRSWASLFIAEILEGLPTTRWLFIHRHGLEVLRSIIEAPALEWLRNYETVSGPLFAPYLSSTGDHRFVKDRDEFVCRMLAAFCRAAAENRSRLARMISYESLTGIVSTILKETYGIAVSEAEEQTMLWRATYYSKEPLRQTTFTPDNDRKQASATAAQRELVSSLVESERARLDF
jgi:hypothetical protein